MKSLADIAGLSQPTKKVAINYSFDVNPDAKAIQSAILSGQEPQGLIKSTPIITDYIPPVIDNAKKGKPKQLEGKAAMDAMDAWHGYTPPVAEKPKVANPDLVGNGYTLDTWGNYDESNQAPPALSSPSSGTQLTTAEADQARRAEIMRVGAKGQPVEKPKTVLAEPPSKPEPVLVRTNPVEPIVTKEALPVPTKTVTKATTGNKSKATTGNKFDRNAFDKKLSELLGQHADLLDEVISMEKSGKENTSAYKDLQAKRGSLLKTIKSHNATFPKEEGVLEYNDPYEEMKRSKSSDEATPAKPTYEPFVTEPTANSEPTLVKKEQPKRAFSDPFGKIETPLDWEAQLQGYQPKYFKNNLIEATYGKSSEKETDEAKKARGVARKYLESADIGASDLENWFSKGKGYDMLKQSIAEDLAWQKGISVKDIPESELLATVQQNIANRIGNIKNATFGFKEPQGKNVAGFTDSKAEEILGAVAGFVRDNPYPSIASYGNDINNISKEERKSILGHIYNPVVYKDKDDNPEINFPKSFSEKEYLTKKNPSDLRNDFSSGKITKEDYVRGMMGNMLMKSDIENAAKHETGHLTDTFMPLSDFRFIQNVVTNRQKNIKSEDRNEFASYLTQPQEVITRVRAIREDAAKKKIKSGDKSDFTKDDLNKELTPYLELIDGGLTIDDILKIANKVSLEAPKKGKSLIDIASA